MSQAKKTLQAGAFERLLASLDADRDRAGHAYEELRRRLVAFFRWRGARQPEDCADETLNVAASRIGEGERVGNVSAYCLGIARLVALERYRTSLAEETALKMLPSPEVGETADMVRRYEVFERALEQLSQDERELVLGYYTGESERRVARRKELAEAAGIPLNALRIRVHRIRQRLERSVREAMERDL